MSSVYGTPRTQDHPVDPVALDQQVALGAAATRLARELDGHYGRETVERFLTSSYQQLADSATAERFARQRLQMALGFFTHHVGDAAVAWSGGNDPAAAVNPAAVAAMAELDIERRVLALIGDLDLEETE